ncbi:hypothetical protein SEPCBS119000_005503 [Sporothrix epigloea]|uniref:BZIP domain-containing protein n=1 Tax=Sporothrix epigloea TaxID=1892477 RepID=A0ABP0E076_9PEZI
MAQPPSPSSTAAVAGPSRAMTETAHAAASNSHPLHDNGVSEAERKRRRRQNYKKLDKTQEGVYERSAKRDQYNNHQSPPFRRLNQVYEVLANVVAPATEFAGAAVNSDTGGTQRDPWQQRFGEPVWTQPPVPSDLKKAVIKSMSKGKGKGKEDDSSA